MSIRKTLYIALTLGAFTSSLFAAGAQPPMEEFITAAAARQVSAPAAQVEAQQASSSAAPKADAAWALMDLPEEILLKIFGHLDMKSLGNMALSCRTAHEISLSVPRDIHLSGKLLPVQNYPFPPHLVRTVKIEFIKDGTPLKYLPLERMERLHTLDLMDVSLNAEDARRIVHTVNTKKSLEKLMLFSIQIDHESITSILDSLKTNTSLRSFLINAKHSLSMEHATQIADLLKTNKSLTDVGVTGCFRNGSQPVTAIIQAVIDTPDTHLKTLSLRGNILFVGEDSTLEQSLNAAHPQITLWIRNI